MITVNETFGVRLRSCLLGSSKLEDPGAPLGALGVYLLSFPERGIAKRDTPFKGVILSDPLAFR